MRLSRSSSSSCRSLWCPLFKSRIDWCKVCRCRSETSMSSKNRTASPSPWGAEEYHSLCQHLLIQICSRYTLWPHINNILLSCFIHKQLLQSSHRWIFPLLFYLPHICISGYHLLCSKRSANVLTWLHSLQCGPLLFPVLSRVATFSLSQSGMGVPSPPCSLPFHRSRSPLFKLGSLGSVVSPPAGSRGRAPTKVDFSTFMQICS